MSTLTVGDDRDYAYLLEALDAASPGDTVVIYTGNDPSSVAEIPGVNWEGDIPEGVSIQVVLLQDEP